MSLGWAQDFDLEFVIVEGLYSWRSRLSSNMSFPYIILVASLWAVAASAQVSTSRGSSQDIVMKGALDGALEKRLETVLRKVLGTDDVFVIANAELLADSDRPDVEVLPGVTVKKTPASPAPLEIPASLVKRITISVFVTHSMSEANIALARKTAERMVGLKPERGDILNVEKLGAPPQAASRLAPFLDQALHPRTILLLAWLLATCGGLALLIRRFFDPFISALREVSHSMQENSSKRAAMREDEPDSPSAAVSAATINPSSGENSAERKLPFSFITERDLPVLNMLLVEQSDIAAAIIVQYLPPPLASRVLAAMPPLKREEVVFHMSSAAVLNPTDVEQIEEIIRSKIDYIMGGEEKLVALLDNVSTAMQAEILQVVRERDPELGERLDRRVIVVEDIGLLDEAGLTALSRLATVRGMAVVLKSSSALRQKVLSKLTSGFGEWLTQETALIGNLPEQVKEMEMRRVLSALIKLVREGKIVLRKDPALRSSGLSPGAMTTAPTKKT